MNALLGTGGPTNFLPGVIKDAHDPHTCATHKAASICIPVQGRLLECQSLLPTMLVPSNFLFARALAFSMNTGAYIEKAEGQWIKTCSILTTVPNAVIATVHDRMPVILDRESYDLWLDPGMIRS
jgi:SOS response associated peptidase (SRAP)